MTSNTLKELEEDKECLGVTEFITDRLYFVSFKNKVPEDNETSHFFTEDGDELDRINLLTIVRYVENINSKLSSPDFASKVLVHFSSGSEKRRCDSAILIGAYAIVNLKKTPEEVIESLVAHSSISPKDSLNALYKAIQFGLVDFEDFDLIDFETLEKTGLHWVVPEKLLLFSGPLPASDECYVPPKNYLRFFKQIGAETLVRIWHNKYDANPFVDAGLVHYDLAMEETVPSDLDLSSFLAICETAAGPVITHCRELLGRAGSLVCALLVKHYRMTPDEAAAWVRFTTLDRLLESQKKWLKKSEESLRKDGDSFRNRFFGDADKIYHHKRGVYSHSVDHEQQDQILVSKDEESLEESSSREFLVNDLEENF